MLRWDHLTINIDLEDNDASNTGIFYAVAVKEMPGLFTQGETLAGTFNNLLDAMALWLDVSNSDLERLLGK